MKRTITTTLILFFLSFIFTVKSNAIETVEYIDVTGIGFTINAITATGPQDINVGTTVLDLDYLNSLSLLRYNSTFSRDEQNSFRDFSEYYSYSSNIYNGYFSGNGSADGFYGEIDMTLSNANGTNLRNCYNQYIGTKKFSLGLYELALPNYSSFLTTYGNHFSQNYYNAVRNLYNSSTPNYDNFFETYGTHMIAQAVYGCRLNACFVVASSVQYFDSSIVNEIQTNLNIIYSNFNGGGSLSMGDMNFSLLNKSDSIIGTCVETYGGSASYRYSLSNNQGGSMYQWVSSTDESNSVIIGYRNGLIPLWEILPSEFSSMAEEMERAYEDYQRYESAFYNNFIFRGTTYKENRAYNGPCRTNEYTITDSGRFNQPYDIIGFSDFGINISECIAQGFIKMDITLNFEVAELYDGYQYVFLYQKESSGSDNILLDSKDMDIGGNSVSRDYQSMTLNFYDIELVKIMNNKLFVRYGASGAGNDTWLNKNFKVTVYLSR